MPVSTSHCPVPSRLTETVMEVSRVLRDMVATRAPGAVWNGCWERGGDGSGVAECFLAGFGAIEETGKIWLRLGRRGDILRVRLGLRERRGFDGERNAKAERLDCRDMMRVGYRRSCGSELY